MKKTGFTKRMLALLLVVIMTVQLLPLSVFAAVGDLKSVDTGIDVSTLKQADAINWPIKIYDYLNDGMLFEFNESSMTGTMPDSQTSAEGGTVPYGGGSAPPVTELGTDFTYSDEDDSTGAWSKTSSSVSTNYYYTNSGYGKSYTLTREEADDYKTPQYAHITDGSTTSRNLLIKQFGSTQYTASTIRYMVIAYRASGIGDYVFQVSPTPYTSTTNWARSSGLKLADSPDWTYRVIDLYSTEGIGSLAVNYIWFSWYTTTTDTAANSSTNNNATNRGMAANAYCDITHVAFFDTLTEATNYGTAAVKFDNNPGEYLRKSASYTTTTTTITYPTRPNYTFSLYYYWKEKNTGSTIDMKTSFYGLDLTTHSTEQGAYVNGYVTHSYHTWKTGSSPSFDYYDYNKAITTTGNSFKMDAIGVEEKVQTNGASYVRLTTDAPSRILLTRLREDQAMNISPTMVPITSYINSVVIVYRANGLTADDKYALWAQGYDNSTLSADQMTASKWGYAGLISDADVPNWASSSKLNPQSFGSADGEWQYAVIPLKETIAGTVEGSTGGDSYMENVTRLARMGMYLPQLSDGKSLDLAYVGYFGDDEAAKTFGEAAKTYLTTEATTKETTATKSYESDRVWNTGNNKGYGMLFASGDGNWMIGTEGGGNYGGSNTTDKYGYDNWMLGYHTAGDDDATKANSVRKDPVTLEPDTGMTNQIYFINKKNYETEQLSFDGYQLLEKVTSGVMTAGLLEGSLRTVTVKGTDYRVPVYRQETVEYIAYLLLHTLRIPKRDANGNYNSTYIAGAPSSQFGGVDLNADGEIGMINLDGDSRTGTYTNGVCDGKETDEASVDLATALRHCLGITFDVNASVGTGGEMGSYDKTLAKGDYLIGQFADCRPYIETTMDAAYYMLNSLFIGNSFNQQQNDYYYLNMPSATLNMSGRTGTAYVFDAGFTVGDIDDATDDDLLIENPETNKNAVVYNPVKKADGTAGTGTISLAVNDDGTPLVTGKTHYAFASNTFTTRFPFLPVTDSEGDYAGGTYSYYYWDSAQRHYHTDSNSLYQLNDDGTSSRRNYNYALVSNGEFVYKEESNLFFDFEGDDDVYLFINGELVLDIGAGHSITKVSIDVNDYVTAARAALKELEKYGYTAEMSIENFDAYITGATLQEYIYDEDTGRITGTKTVNNPYLETPEKIAEFKRWARLDLTDGEICKFDFYYMERKSWGANMRIVTNMHITDPTLDVDKTAYQFDKEIEYGGVIDPTSSLEYNFSLNNSGNTKLYNLTFRDDVIGVSLDPTNGLTVGTYGTGDSAISRNGIYVLDANGKTLEAKDLSARVEGYNAAGEYVTVDVTFPEVNNDGGQQALKDFLYCLAAEGTDPDDYDDAEVTRAGKGLWVGTKVTFKGIYYMLTPEQTKEGKVLNTVYVSATTRLSPSTVGNQTLYSDAEHLVYTSGFPVHYQWAGHNIFLNLNTMLQHAYDEAEKTDSQLHQYNEFFKSVKAKAAAGTGKGTDYIYYNLCDKYGRVGGYYPYQTPHTDGEGNIGYLINYDEPGVYTFYILLYLRSGAKQNYQENYNASQIDSTEYAIIRSQVYVADVKDSVYVLDYGLSTESLDVAGELFKNDYLFGPYGTIRSKLMGVSKTEPSYLDPKDVKSGTDYSRIKFTSIKLDATNKVETDDGVYSVNLAIPETGKLISYDSTTGQYSLTGVGTVTITAVVPAGENSSWGNPYLYYWYDDGTTGPAWPGTIMKDLGGGGKYQIDIPADVSKVIINNGSGAVQTEDLTITPGLSCTITVGDKAAGSTKYTASIETILQQVTYHAKKPDAWSDVVVHYLSDGEWQVAEKTSDTVDANGYYLFQIPGNVTSVYLSDGGDNSTAQQTVYAGREVWLEVDQPAKYSPTGSYTVHASVPEKWRDTVYVYYWYEGQTNDDWPGVPMTKDESGWYTREGIPSDITHLIINDGKDGYQTVDLTVSSGMETWVMVNDQTVPAGGTLKYTASVAYGSEHTAPGLTFTPKDFMDQENNLWLAITVHSTSANPTAINTGIDIHNEVQMYKKITVLPATVVYYEDDFTGINYNEGDVTCENVFEFHGNGSGRLTQSVDRDQPYGQDASYQDDDNTQYSGGSEHTVTVMDDKQVAYFTFTGTGFELISRTNATDSASIVVRVYKSTTYASYATQYAAYKTAMAKYQSELAAFEADTTGTLTEPTMPTEPIRPDADRIIPVITQFDHGNDGGDEAIDQVPTIRVKDLDLDEYTVELSGMPTLDFSNMEYDSTTDEVTGVTVVPTTLYIDGIRIFQPMGNDHEAYTDPEKYAEVKELRDLIVDGLVAFGTLKDNKLSLSSGTITWTESLLDENYDSTNDETYESTQVESTDDYMIKGPNNEVYMDGTVNQAIIFYVTKDADSAVHDLQIAVRALDHKQFYGNGSSAPDVQLQYGVLQSDGYAWKNFVRVVSSTEQYYTIPFEECPMDSEGRYQIILRAVNAESGADAMVSYTSVKLNGLNVEKVNGVGEGTILYYKNGLLIRPDYYLIGNINGVEYTGTSDLETMYHFVDGKVTLTFNEATKVAIRRELDGNTKLYDSVYLDVPAGEVTLFLKQTKESSLSLDYCLHTWDEGVVTGKPNCTDPEVKTFTCTLCGHTKDIAYATNGEHEYHNGTCIHCGIGEDKYYLVGYINGANYGCEEDYQNMGEYLFVDGQLVVTFKQGSYVFVKSADNQGWYMTDGWLGEVTSATLYDSSTLQNQNKLFVPAGWEITFTLVANDDGTFTLSYTKHCPTHSWNEGEVDKDVSCTEDGSTKYTCTICGETKTETVEATGHSYGENGTCSACGAERKRTIYFRNSQNWATAYIWLWDADSKQYTQNGWPGDPMTPVAGENGLYSYEVPMSATGVLFNNGTDAYKTGDLIIPSNSLVNEYNYDTGKWMYTGYYLVGYINSADYDGETYMFEDGKLVVTFDADKATYVYIKTAEYKRYMTEGFLGSVTSATLVDNSTISNGDKLQVPVGVELTFTLVVNDDGTLTLSYTERCDHLMNAGEITTPATCIHDGIKTYTCTKCGETETEVVPATGVHTFGEESPYACTTTGCGALRTYTVYFQNDFAWDQVYIWAWDSTTNYTGGNWPGVPMTKDDDTGLYSFELPAAAQNVIFNNGDNNQQTGDLTAPIASDAPDKTKYIASEYRWIGSDDVVEYCIFGYIDGADVACNNDYTNVDVYRFTDTITLTFTQTSYIAVKSVFGTDNGTWYMLSSYQEGSDSATFYNGGNEKWCLAPGTYTFTLVKNTDGSVTLSQVQAQAMTLRSSIELANSAAVYSAEENGAVVLPPVYFMGDEENALNLFAINQQMSSNVIVGETDDSTSDTTCTHTWDGNECTNCGYTCEHLNTTYGQVKDQITGMRTFTITCTDCGRVHICTGENFMGAKYVNLVLSNDITVQYTVTIPTEFEVEIVDVSFEMVGKTTTVDTYKSLSDYERVYNFEGVVSQAMGETITSTVHMMIDGMHVYDVMEYSVLEYCNDVLADSDASEELKQLCVDMLYYGAASQKFNNYKTDDLVSSHISGTSSTFTALTEADNKLTYTETSNEYYFAGATLVLDNAINVRFDLKAVDAAATVAKITYGGKTYEYNVSDLEARTDKNNRYYLYFEGVTAGGLDELIICELYQDDTRVGDTMTYSVNSYVYEKQADSNAALQELVQALYNYGESTKAYVASQG